MGFNARIIAFSSQPGGHNVVVPVLHYSFSVKQTNVQGEPFCRLNATEQMHKEVLDLS